MNIKTPRKRMDSKITVEGLPERTCVTRDLSTRFDLPFDTRLPVSAPEPTDPTSRTDVCEISVRGDCRQVETFLFLIHTCTLDAVG